jgi:PiT family inorganic phosphate transporter
MAKECSIAFNDCMETLFGPLDTVHVLCLVLALALALGFEFVNGFHDTANAVATVIYTNSLPPWVAVVWSGMWNLIGVLTSTGAVAFGIISLLPVELVMNVGSAAGFAMVFSLLVSAIVWNLGTWYLGLPASSSHTLIGSIMGVGLMNSMMNEFHDELGRDSGWHQLGQSQGRGHGTARLAHRRFCLHRAAVPAHQGIGPQTGTLYGA